jgi:hypothetical protein
MSTYRLLKAGWVRKESASHGGGRVMGVRIGRYWPNATWGHRVWGGDKRIKSTSGSHSSTAVSLKRALVWNVSKAFKVWVPEMKTRRFLSQSGRVARRATGFTRFPAAAPAPGPTIVGLRLGLPRTSFEILPGHGWYVTSRTNRWKAVRRVNLPGCRKRIHCQSRQLGRRQAIVMASTRGHHRDAAIRSDRGTAVKRVVMTGIHWRDRKTSMRWSHRGTVVQKVSLPGCKMEIRFESRQLRQLRQLKQ